MNTAVLFIIFNRTDLSLATLAAIAVAQPKRLYISADGPRYNNPDDAERCEQTRKAVLAAITWPCEVKTRFLDENMGCDSAVPSAIHWFFQHESQGIILEDDCLPDPSFFGFCETLLHRYQLDTRVMHIAGSYLLDSAWSPVDSSYYWTRHPLIHGWATWKRAWEHFSMRYPHLETFEMQRSIQDVIPYWLGQAYRMFHWRKLNNRLKHTQQAAGWDFAWCYTVITQNGLCANAGVNLIRNTGYGSCHATHPTLASNPLSKVPLGTMATLVHPVFMLPSVKRDVEVLKKVNFYSVRGIVYKLIEKLVLFCNTP
jgi:hypothetical protein